MNKIKNFLYLIYTFILWIKYTPDCVSLINDTLKCNRYGFGKYLYEKIEYDHEDNYRYFKYPFPNWFNKLYYKYLIKL